MTKTLLEWLLYLEQLHPQSIDLGLERVHRVAIKLNLLPSSAFAIVVGGTNGKGSTVALLESILLAQGYRVGTYTSPHLLSYHERIKINGVNVDEHSLCDAFEKIEKARGSISLTYFEFGTLAALLIFQAIKLDVMILEVGMGGRLDAVNIVDADIAVITTLAIDHQEWLGNDRESIAFEKAGIMRANKPVVCGDTDPPHSIFDEAKKINAKLFSIQDNFSYSDNHHTWTWFDETNKFVDLPLPKIELQNAATALKVITLLPSELTISDESIREGLQNVFIPGRFQIIPGEIRTILDVAHNPAGATLLASQLKKLPHQGKTFAVIAMLGDKDKKGTVLPLIDQIDGWWVAGLDVPRGESPSVLADALKTMKANGVSEHASVSLAYRAAMEQSVAEDQIIVFGSFHTVAAILEVLDCTT